MNHETVSHWDERDKRWTNYPRPIMTSGGYCFFIGYLTRRSYPSFRALQASSAPRIYVEEYMPHGQPLSISQSLVGSFQAIL
jgi:hypothetical protein